MSEIIQQWIYDRLKRKLNFISDEQDIYLYNGWIIGELLQSYNIINSDNLLLIEQTNDPEVIVNNYEHIRKWLLAINVEIDDEYFNDITTGVSSAIIRLFYELYLSLNDNFYLKRKSPKIAVVSRKKEILIDKFSDNNLLKEILVTNEDRVDWKKISYEKLLECYKTKKEELRQLIEIPLEDADEVKFNYSEESLKPLNETVIDKCYKELLDELIKIENLDKFEIDYAVSDKILKKFQKRIREKEKLNVIRGKLHRMLLEKLWQIIVEKQNRIFEENISDNVLKQSDFEKKIITKDLDEKESKENNLRNIQAELKKIRDCEDTRFVEKLLQDKSKQNISVQYYYQQLYRKFALHRTLYEEKLNNRKQSYKTFCNDVFNNIVNLAIKFGEYREEFKSNPNWFETFKWKDLMIKGKPFIETIQDSDDDLSCECDEDDDNFEHFSEVDTNIFINNLFNKYLNYEQPFALDDDPNNQSLIQSCRLGLNILGYIVYKALLTKYPKPCTPEPTDLPQVDFAVCLTGLNELNILPNLQKLLTEKGIIIIEIEDCIKFCKNAYVNETIMEYEEPLPEVVEKVDGAKKGKKKDKKGKTDKKGKKDKKENKSDKKKKDDKKSKSGTSKDSKVKSEPKFCDKEMQTPYIFPCEVIYLTNKAELGRLAEEAIGLGEELNDELIVNMFIEYLKSLKNIKGWVLINFPKTICQAALLEEQLTGKPIPFYRELITTSNTSLEEIISNYYIKMTESDENTKCRRESSLLTNPKPEYPDNYYDTYLTAFITLKETLKEEEKVQQYCYVYEEKENQEEKVSHLEQFYTDQGCNYVLNYDTFDFPTVKQIGKLIIGEYTIPPKKSKELFGANLDVVEQDMVVVQIPKGKKDKQKNDGGKKKKNKKDATVKNVIVIETDDKESQVPDLEEEVELYDNIDHIEELSDGSILPEPGEWDWNYVSVPMSHIIVHKLATIWESIEENYCTDLKHFLLFHSININAHIPYTQFVTNFINKSIYFFIDVQNYIDEFQNIYNKILDQGSYDECARSEIQCRIAQLREKLWSMVDDRTFYMESIRTQIIERNWLAYQAIEFLNLHISCLQIEIDRTINSIQFINDYYICMIKRKFPLEYLPENSVIKRICILKDVYDVNCIIQYLQNCLKLGTATNEKDPILRLIQTKYDECEEIIRNCKIVCDNLLDEIPLIFNATISQSYEKLASISKYVEPTKEVKTNSANILNEWKYAIDGECARIKLRIKLINQLTNFEWKNIINLHIKHFSTIRNKLSDCYANDIYNINKIFEVCSRAADKQVPLEKKLTLKESKMSLKAYDALFQDEENDSEISEEISTDYNFNMFEINKLIDIFINLSPNGFLSKRSFIYILQDIILCKQSEKVLPIAWYNLNKVDVIHLTEELFGQADFIDWKDFIIYNLELPIPTHEELLNIRQQFRRFDSFKTENISTENFYKTTLWFENVRNFSISRINYVRDILIRLFLVNDKIINYTKLLLSFCKDKNPIEGFAKALELSIGNYVCWDNDIGKDFINIIMTKRYEDEQMRLLREQEHKDNISMTCEILDSAVSDTVHLCDSVLIDDYYSEEAEEEQIFENLTEESILNLNESFMEQSENNSSIFTTFTNISIGFECREYCNIIYILPLKTLNAIMSVSIPNTSETYESFMNKINVIYEQCKHEDFNNEVLVHDFLNNVYFKDVLDNIFKFKDISLKDIISKLCRCNK